MREALRGTLLSVLFFALLIGGAPTIAAAGQPESVTSAHTSPGACTDNGGSWINKSSPGNPNGYCTYDDLTWDEMVGTDPWCSLMRAGQTAASLDAAVIGFIFGGPVGGAGAALLVGGLVEIYITYHCG
ncbi:MAG: hypothetical protein OXP74_07260 [Acidobacteriota bacterium]|nr:hypothetical protein [Acidobacteriota bacterium]